jgi:beta-lactam-binding protein with PASTA domain
MRSDIQRALSGYPVGAQMRPTSSYVASGPGTRRMDPLGATQLQGSTGAIPPYQYGPPDTGPRASRRRRRPIWPWVTAVVALVVIAAIVLAYMALTGHGTPAGIAVPSVVGDKLTKAEQALQKKGFQVNAVPQITSTGVPNVVTSTSPAGGSLASKGSTVKVVYNARPGAKAVPSVRGMTTTDAEATLNAAGFKIVFKSGAPRASLTIPAGRVISTSPPAGTKVSPTTTIVLNLSGGGAKVPVVTDEQSADAQTAVKAAGLVPIVVKQPGPPGATPGTVWETKPGTGTVVLPGTTVTLYVVPGSSSPSSTPSSPSTSPSSTSPSSPPPSGSPSGTPSP